MVAVSDNESIKLKVKDKALFAKYSGPEFKYDDMDYQLMESNDILASLN